MNEIAKNTITSMEVAEMVNKQHKELLRDIRKYCSQLNESKIALVEFFTESDYTDSHGQKRPCYLVTKKGCEFIAHKLTGQKGTEFTARYINRFHEMEQGSVLLPPEQVPVGEVASYAKTMDRIAVREGLAPHRIAANFKKVSEQFGIYLTDDFVKVPDYEQLKLPATK